MLYNARSRSNKKSTPIIPNSKALRYQERWKSSSHPPNTQPRSNKEPTLVLTPIIPPIRKLRDTKRVENHHVQILNPDSTKSQPPSNLHRSHSKSPSQTSKNDVQSSWWYAINTSHLPRRCDDKSQLQRNNHQRLAERKRATRFPPTS